MKAFYHPENEEQDEMILQVVEDAVSYMDEISECEVLEFDGERIYIAVNDNDLDYFVRVWNVEVREKVRRVVYFDWTLFRKSTPLAEGRTKFTNGKKGVGSVKLIG